MSVTLSIRVRNVYGDPLPDRGDIEIFEHSTDQLVGLRRDRTLTPTLSVEADENELYRVRVFPTRYRPVGHFVRAPAGGTRRHDVVCPVHPDRVTSVDFPAWASLPGELRQALEASAVEGFEQLRGEPLYGALDEIRRAGLLNLFAKMAFTNLPNGRTIWSYVESLYRIRGDRVFANVAQDLRDAVKTGVSAGQFEPADDKLHTPPPGFGRAGSFKTLDAFGNLQLSFFASEADPLRFRVDADIDDARGIAHLFQVLRNFLSGNPTHPYDIHEILVASQKLDPGYLLKA